MNWYAVRKPLISQVQGAVCVPISVNMGLQLRYSIGTRSQPITWEITQGTVHPASVRFESRKYVVIERSDKLNRHTEMPSYKLVRE